jgi:hypothetical protein
VIVTKEVEFGQNKMCGVIKLPIIVRFEFFMGVATIFFKDANVTVKSL